MSVDAVTVTLLGSVLNSTTARKLFAFIANSRIAQTSELKAMNPEPGNDLTALQSADLIGAGAGGEKYFVTAKGLKVARDLEQIPLG